jgi:uncharacterized repeat protein (TIGR03803 family)
MWLTKMRRRWFSKSRSGGRAPRSGSVPPRVRDLETRLTPSVSTLASFSFPYGSFPWGGNPSSALIMDSSGNLYGTAPQGGAFGQGTVVELARGSGALITLASFNGTDGGSPQSALLMDSSGNLYGTTASGGPDKDGTVFELAHGSSTITTLASFDGTDGANPYGALIVDGSGNFYGTTVNGGTSNDGTVFELAKGSGMITTLASFDGTDGANPYAGLLMDSSGNLYGTSEHLGAEGDGTLFQLANGSGTITTLFSFGLRPNGAAPYDSVIMDSSGNLYGTTSGNGLSGDPTVFEFDHATGTLTTLASFNDGSNGAYPVGALAMDSGGNLYGTTEFGGAYGGACGYGTVFELPHGSGAIMTLASFDGTDGSNPAAGLVMDSSGNLYGTTTGQGFPYKYGTVFEFAAGSGTIDTLASFSAPRGANPAGPVAMDSKGDLYGTTFLGGPSDDGTVFEWVRATGSVKTLASFNGTNGQDPGTGLMMDTAGNLYGTTYYGGAFNDGTVFELAAGSGTITALASFNGTDGSTPAAAPLVDAGGNLYGTTYRGGASGDGTVFEVRAGSGTITTLVSFNGTNGALPEGALTMDSKGNLYGITEEGGTYGYGTVFELAPSSGAITTLATFNRTNGSYPAAGLLMDSSGNLYGTADEGGKYGYGTVFELAHGSGTITTLVSFNGINAFNPYGTLLMDPSGNLYTTVGGDPSGGGMVIELPQGRGPFTTLAAFDVTNGGGPSGLVMDRRGDLYGIADWGGVAGDGTVFEMPGAVPDQWTGANAAVDTNWSDGANWSLGTPPMFDQTALFTDNSLVKGFTATADAGFTHAIGRLEIDSTWGGTITVKSPLAVTGSFTLASGSFGGSGAVTIGGSASQWTGGRIDLGSGGLTNTGTFTWTGGQLDLGSGGFTNTGTLDLEAGMHNLVVTGAGTLTNDGTIEQTGATSLVLGNATTLLNAATGVYDIRSILGLAVSGGGAFTNAGTLEKTGGTGTAIIATNTLDNTGTVEVTSGTLDISATVTQVSGRTLTGGSWTVIGSPTVHAKLDIISAGHFTTLGSGATVTLSGTTVAFPNLTSLATIDAGATLSLQAGQARTTVGALTNAGNLVLGAGSVLTVSGSFTQTSTGKLTIKLGGTHAAPTFGQLVSTTGTVALGGSLSVGSTSLPAVGTSFEVLDNEGSSVIGGIFKGLSEGATFKVKRGTTTMTFQITYAGTDADGDENVIVTRIS